MKQLIDVVYDKVRIFEKSENTQTADHRADKNRSGNQLPMSILIDQRPVDIIKDRGENHDENVYGLSPCIKIRLTTRRTAFRKFTGDA